MKIVKYGTVEITWGADDRPCVDVRGFSVDCEGEIHYPIAGRELVVKLLKDIIDRCSENVPAFTTATGVSLRDKEGNRIK